jgi:hypothetical protein
MGLTNGTACRAAVVCDADHANYGALNKRRDPPCPISWVSSTGSMESKKHTACGPG